MSRRMLKHRYPTGSSLCYANTGKATETAQPVAPLPQPAADVMPQWDGTASFQPAQYPAAVLDPQQPQNTSQEGWPSLPTAAANSSTAGSAVQYGQGENYWNWNMHQESAAVAGGDGMTSPSTQSWNSGGWSAPQPEVTSARPQSWTGGGGVQPPNPTGVGGGANLHEAAVAPVTSDGTYHPASLYTGAQYVPPQEGQQYASGGAVTEGTGPQEGWVPPPWSSDTSQWPAGNEQQQQQQHQQQYDSVQAQWQWQEGMPAEGWQTANNQWQGYDSQVGGTSHAGQYEGSSVGAYSPSDDSLHCLEQHQQQQHQQGQSQQLHEQGLPSTAGDSATADVSSPAHPSNFASDSHDGSQGIVGSLQEKSQQYVESGDEGTISMFFQDGSASVHVMKEEGMAEAEESREGHSTHDMQMAPEHVEKQPASLGTESREQEVAAMGMPEDGATVTTESVNQEVPDSVLRPEPQEAVPLHMEGSGPGSEEGVCAVALTPGVELGAQCPAPSKKAVIRARQGGPFKPPVLVRQGSTETALLQQNAVQLHLPPDNLELLPPDEVARHASLRHLHHRQGVASSPTGAVGTGLTLLDAPDMQAVVTLAPAAPPIPHDRPASRGGSPSGVESNEVVVQSSIPLTSAPAPTEEVTPLDGHSQATVPRMVAPPLMRQSPLGREEGAGRSTIAPPPLRVAATLAPSPLLVDSTLPERTEPSGSTDGENPLPVVTATRVGEVKESLVALRPNATSTPTADPSPHHEAINVSAVLAHPKRDTKEPSDKASESRVRQEEPPKEKHDDGSPRDHRDDRDFRESRDSVHGQDYRDSRDSRPARGRGSDDESSDCKGSRDDFERDSRRIGGRADFRNDQEKKRDRYHDRPENRRDGAKDDRDEYRRAGGRSGGVEDWKRRDDYHGDRRGDRRDDQYEDRRVNRREELRDDVRKSIRRGDHYYDRRDQWRGHESDDDWKERRSDRRTDRYSSRHDYRYDDRQSDRYSDRGRPSSRTSQDAYLDDFDRRGNRRHRDSHNRPSSRHSESDSSSPDSRRGYSTVKHRKYRDAERMESGTYHDQKSYAGAGGYDYNAYRRDYYNYYHYGYAPRSGYGYGYYDELYRTNPAYKQQVDAYYARLGYNPAQVMERLSVHSGRSSANGDSRRDESFASNTEDDCDPSILDHESSRLDHVPQPEEVKKFSRPHPLARFCGTNGLLKLIPTLSSGDLPPPIEIHSLKHLFQKDPQFHELQAFPGPLVRSETHKNDVIQFCTQRIQSFADDPSLPDRSSHILLWELLVLMLRQNGFVSGSDIADLLLRGHEILEPSTSASALASRPAGEGGEAASLEGADDGSSPSPDEGIVVSDRAQLGSTGSSRVLAKFREFLLFGHKKDALEWAVKCGLWGHALSLASKMDARTYAGIMTRFTNALAINDPLQTLYQHLSGRQPAAVTCIADEKWGDWRPHLAMILSNPSSRPEVDARSITTLGDVLASRGCLSAAHFCYLMAQVEFGTYACKSSKMVLLGSNHHTLPFEEFATNEAIQCTEIYEYSQSLANAGYMLPHLQTYKFLHATRLAEYGFAQEALHYCEVLAEAMVRHCESAQLAAQTYELANRLKYHDPHFSQGQGELEELGEPLWLANFAHLVNQLLQQLRGNSSMSQVGIYYGQESGYEGHLAQPVSGVPSMESLHGQQGQGFNSSTGFSMYDSNMSILEKSGNANSSYLDTSACGDSTQVASPSAEQWTSLPKVTHDYTQHPSPMSASSFVAAPTSADSGWSTVPQLSTPAPPPLGEYNFVSTSPPSLPAEPAAVMNGMSPQADGSAPSSPPVSSQPATFDYYKASTYSPQNMQHHRTSRERLSSVSSSADTRDRRDSVDSAALASGRSRLPSGPQSSLATDQSASESERSKPSSASKGKTQVAGKSWLGGIFGKLLPKGPNQMILPDDKDPDIVWDEQKKCWVDKNAAPGEAESRMAAPPSDTSFGGKPSPVSSKPGENRFQLSKQRSLRKHYVDVLNPSSNKASGDSPSAPAVAAFPEQSAAQAPVQYFVPQAVGDQHAENSGYDFVSPTPLPDQTAPAPPPPPETVPAYQPTAKAVSTPMMFDPADFSSGVADSSRNAAGGNMARRRAYPT
ncbi:uncharacterized protein LOC119160912 isoform X3 [Rhipicephalus microplus]|uniref:uncharacterized protein LOC119160912 isoform X3 n=1 Tax=Rhipicephalus microplus TaxID=6941 RepID=UPI003F6AB9FD